MVKLTYQPIMMMNEVLIQIQAGQFAILQRFDGFEITFNTAGHSLNQLRCAYEPVVWKMPFSCICIETCSQLFWKLLFIGL